MRPDADRRDDEAAAEAQRRRQHRLARPDAVEPDAGEGGRYAEKYDRDAGTSQRLKPGRATM
jgi:hypothetical protein